MKYNSTIKNKIIMGTMPRKDYVKPSAASKITLATAIAGDVVTVNGNDYTAVAGVKADDTEFSIDTSDSATATDLADSIDGDVRVGTQTGVVLSASSTADSLTITSVGVGSGNVKMLSSDPATIILASSSLNLDGLTSNVDDNNEVVKRVNIMNTPFSIQQTGVENIDDRLEVITNETEFNTLTTRQRVLLGNKEGWIKTVTASTSIVIAYQDEVKAEQTITLTMAQVIANSPQSIFIINENI